jgi:hypothetical protein
MGETVPSSDSISGMSPRAARATLTTCGGELGARGLRASKCTSIKMITALPAKPRIKPMRRRRVAVVL